MLRFEVFKRDGFQCAYCGKTPPDVILEVDHIKAKSKGGSEDINNLLTSCFDCNRGKRNIPLTTVPAKVTENLEILHERERQLKEYYKFIKQIERRINNDIEEISKRFTVHFPQKEFTEHFKNATLKRLLKSLPKHLIIESLDLAASKFSDDPDRVIRYFCGICWKRIKGEDNKGRPHSEIPYASLPNENKDIVIIGQKGKGHYEIDLKKLEEYEKKNKGEKNH